MAAVFQVCAAEDLASAPGLKRAPLFPIKGAGGGRRKSQHGLEKVAPKAWNIS